jgi:hypothetical protein
MIDFQNIIQYFKKINFYLYSLIISGLVLYIVIVYISRHNQYGFLMYYILFIFLLNSFLSIYAYARNIFIAYFLTSLTLIVQMIAILVFVK